MNPKIHRFILCKILGWHVSEDEIIAPSDRKAIFLFAPHTSFWDFVVGYLFFRSYGERLKVMIKKEAFKGPLGWLLRKLGAFPIDRANSQATMVHLIHSINESDKFYMVICPEGTRRPVKRWKTGYHTIARETGIPVYLSHADYRKKEVGYGKKVELTDNAREDTNRIQQLYKEMGLTAKHPKQFVTE